MNVCYMLQVEDTAYQRAYYNAMAIFYSQTKLAYVHISCLMHNSK